MATGQKSIKVNINRQNFCKISPADLYTFLSALSVFVAKSAEYENKFEAIVVLVPNNLLSLRRPLRAGLLVDKEQGFVV